MRSVEWKKVKKHYATLIEGLDLMHTLIVDTLYEKDTLSEHDKERLDTTHVSRDKNRLLLGMLKKKKDLAYSQFRDTLQVHQEHLYRLLDPPSPSTKPDRRIEHDAEDRQPPPDKSLDDFTVADLQEWLKPVVEKAKLPSSILDTFTEQEIDGKVFQIMTAEDLEKLLPAVKFGPRKRLMHERDRAMEEMAVGSQKGDSKPILKRIECTVKTFKYKKEYILRKQTR